MNTEQPVWITSNLCLTRQEVTIIDHLVDYNEMPKDFNQDRAITFFVGEDLHLVLYFSEQADRGFQMYIVRDFSVNVDDMCLLSNSLSHLIRSGYKQHIIENAKGRIDQMIYMAGTFRALFGKKATEEEEFMC
jgi:hypothetical protein